MFNKQSTQTLPANPFAQVNTERIMSSSNNNNTFVRPSPPRHTDLGAMAFEDSKFNIETIPTQRVESYSSTASTDSQASTRSASWIKPAPTVNVHTTCGRHTDQLLFGGPSLRELARSFVKRK